MAATFVPLLLWFSPTVRAVLDPRPHDQNPDMCVLQGGLAYSIPTLRSVSICGTNGKDTSGMVSALLPSKWRVVPNLVALELSDIIADASTGVNPIRKIGEAIERYAQLPALEELTLRNCSTLESDIGPLAAALKKGNAPELRVLSCCNNEGNLGSVTELLLEALAHGAHWRPELQVLSFADNWSFVNTPLLHLKEALQACPRLRTLRIDCSLEPAPELRSLATSINQRQQPALEHVFVRVPSVMSDDEPTRGSAEYLSSVAETREEPFSLEMELG